MCGDGAILLALVAGGCGATDLLDSHRLGRLSASWTTREKAALPPAALCCISDNIEDERLRFTRNQKDHYTELDELRVMQPFDWEGAVENLRKTIRNGILRISVTFSQNCSTPGCRLSIIQSEMR